MSKPGNLRPGNFSRKRPSWILEDAKLFHRLFIHFSQKREQGQTLRQALKQPVWFWRGRTYRNAPSRQICISRETFLRRYYKWVSGGRTLEAAKLGYRSGRAKLSQAKLGSFVEAAANSDARSYAATLKILGDTSVTGSAYSHALSPGIRKVLNDLFAVRRRADFCRRVVQRAIKARE